MNFVRADSQFQRWEHLFHHSDIQTVGPGDEIFFDDLPNVDMDKMLVTAGKAKFLATDSLSYCFAFCARGRQADGTPVLGLWHKTPLDSAWRRGFSVLKQQMEKQGCDARTIEGFVIGGQAPAEETKEPGTVDDELDILRLADRENIKGVLFNYSSGEDEPLSVVLTPKTIYVSKRDLFDSSKKNEEAGYCLSELQDKDRSESPIERKINLSELYPKSSSSKIN